MVQVDWGAEAPGRNRLRYIPNPYYHGASLYKIEYNSIALVSERGELNTGDPANLKRFFDSCYESSCSKLT